MEEGFYFVSILGIGYSGAGKKGLEKRKERIEGLLELVGLSNKAEQYPRD